MSGECTSSRPLTVAIEGCCHGELDKIYTTIAEAELKGGNKVDLLIVCGDFQCVKDSMDLQCVAVPQKYRKLNTFHQYVSGEKQAPVLTIFIGGNHEASNVLQSLYYGGWVCPNIYFMGFAGVVCFGGLRIAGISGIFNPAHYRRGHFEMPPYSDDTMRSVYHVRELEVYRMALLSTRRRQTPIDICFSHDWPNGVWDYGNVNALLRVKPYFKEDIRSGKLGSPPLMSLLRQLQPSYWFAAHLHVKFAAEVPHLEDPENADAEPSKAPTQDRKPKSTKFLSLDKVQPGRDFLQIITIPIPSSSAAPHEPLRLEYDAEWIAILRNTHNLLTTHHGSVAMPQELLAPSDEDIEEVRDFFGSRHTGLAIPPLEVSCRPCAPPASSRKPGSGSGCGNVQTDAFLAMLGLQHIWTVPMPTDASPPPPLTVPGDPNEISIDEEEGGDPCVTSPGHNGATGAAAGPSRAQKPVDANEIDIDDEEN